MNMHSTLTAAADALLTRTEVAGLVALAARTVAPLWPLTSAIAVNPLAGFEDRPFAEAVRAAAARFDARAGLPIISWRRLYQEGRIDPHALRSAAIGELGGIYRAQAIIAPGVSALDVLLGRLLDEPPAAPETAAEGPRLTRAAAFVAKWCAAFFDQGQAAAPMPHRSLGLYRAVLALAPHDPEFRALAGATGEHLLLTVPRDPLEAIAEGLAGDGRDPLEVLSGLVARLPGWAGHLRWRSEHADPDVAEGAPATMADLLALWLLLERAGAAGERPADRRTDDSAEIGRIARHAGIVLETLTPAKAARFAALAALDEAALGALFMTAAEWTYANALVPALERAAAIAHLPARPDAQLVFCIDVRSEPMRRAIERAGNYETFGYAGFFGLPIALKPADGGRRQRLLPVLLSPRHELSEAARPGAENEAAAVLSGDARRAGGATLADAAKLGAGSAFATAEALGPLFGLGMVARTVAPRLLGRRRQAQRARRSAAIGPCAASQDHRSHAAGLTLADRIGYGEALFRLTGMRGATARLVVLAGHGGRAVNNPYAAALDCGACGGHAGGSNARVLAAILNDPLVRTGLAERDIVIPESTRFLAAEHDTTTDRFTLFDTDVLPDTHRADLARLEADLARAGDDNRARRAALLARTAGDLEAGADHWGEVRPEWGLAGNAGFVVGPRDWTAGIDLEGRAFLHSYDWRSDDSGEALATILTAPMVVAQWINCQYLFSTLDNDRYGAGDKTTHNVVAGVGVVQGNGGDLQVGLPRQSLFDDAGVPYHVPQRLLTVVLAPPERVRSIVEEHDLLARLFDNGWVQLVVVDPETGKGRRWRGGAPAAASDGTTIHSLTC